MNFCTKCDSYYQKPGTCNCYAQMTVSTPWPLPHPDETTAIPYPYFIPITNISGYGTIIDNGNGLTGAWINT